MLGNARLSWLPTDCPRVMAALLLRALPVADWREGGAQAEVLLRRLSSAVEEGVASKAMQRVPHLVLLAPAFYKERLRPLLARWLLLLLLQLGLKDLTPAEVRDLVITPKNLTPASCVT